VASEVLGIPVKTDPLTAEGKPELVIAFQDATAAFDSRRHLHLHHLRLGPGRRGRRRWPPACGEEFTLENVAKIGERIWNMERDFNNRAGFTSKDDNLPPRLLNEAGQDRPGQGPGQQAARDAAQVLRRPRLGRRRPAQARDARTPGAVTKHPAPPADPLQGGFRTALRCLGGPP
jgi:aldehyde:ferredoxin oxidoreductase